MRETCFSGGTDFATKKSWAAFSKSIMTAGVRSPVVRMGALPLVGSTVARVDIVVFGWIYAWLSSSDESVERTKDKEELDGGGKEWRWLDLDSWRLLRACKVGTSPSRMGNCWVRADAHVKQGFSRIDMQTVDMQLAVKANCPPLMDGWWGWRMRNKDVQRGTYGKGWYMRVYAPDTAGIVCTHWRW